jgi:N-acetylmuramoyl-L-alanine amidase
LLYSIRWSDNEMPYLRFPKPRFRLSNYTRFIAFILVFLLAATAIVVALTRSNEEDPAPAAIVVTPVATPIPTPTPEPTPTPYPVPEGKIMEEVIIVLDPGHGGRDPGTISPYQEDFYEKDVTLDIAKRVQAILVENGIQVVMTREGDERLVDSQKEDLAARAEVANKSNALFCEHPCECL